MAGAALARYTELFDGWGDPMLAKGSDAGWHQRNRLRQLSVSLAGATRIASVRATNNDGSRLTGEKL